MSISRIAVGGLMLEQLEKWRFDFQGGIIVGRRQGDDVGLLCIRHVASNLLPGPITHAYCLEVARQVLKVPNDPVEYFDALETPSGPYGAATFVGAADVRRVWYSKRPPGMIVGAYSCPARFAGDAVYRITCAECRRIMSGAIFDRPSWGGDDPLTRILIDGLEGPEPDRGAEEKP
jgi:hypothetical protein